MQQADKREEGRQKVLQGMAGREASASQGPTAFSNTAALPSILFHLCRPLADRGLNWLSYHHTVRATLSLLRPVVSGTARQQPAFVTLDLEITMFAPPNHRRVSNSKLSAAPAELHIFFRPTDSWNRAMHADKRP